MIMGEHMESVLAKADNAIARGGTVFFKFTCINCGQRLTFDKPNTLYARGTCDQCGAETPIEKGDLGFLLELDFGGNIETAGVMISREGRN